MKQKRIFISHNSEWRYIDDFASLIRELGYYPVVVEKEADLGKNPQEKSEHYMQGSDMIIFVITKDAVDKSGRPHPKSNVAMEMGLAKNIFKPEQRVFLLEEDARPPSMVKETYVSVGRDNYYGAIAQLIKDIRAVLPLPVRQEHSAAHLGEVERFILLTLTRTSHGQLARPDLLRLVTQKFSIGQSLFNIARSKLRSGGFTREGEIMVGHPRAGDLFIELTELGWELTAELTEDTKI